MDVDTVCEANNPGSRRKLNHNFGLNAKYWSSAEWNKSYIVQCSSLLTETGMCPSSSHILFELLKVYIIWCWSLMNLELAYVLHHRVLEFDEFKIGLSFKYIIYTTVC